MDKLTALISDVLDWACGSDEPDEEGYNTYIINTHCQEHEVRARKHDGEWQVLWFKERF